MSPIPFVVLALCGLAFGAVRPVPRFDSRIVGGAPTTIEEHPYQLSVRHYSYNLCGATIIGPNHALTSAYCMEDIDISDIVLHAGTSYLDQDGSSHPAKKITVHPEYKFYDHDYDFAIIEVDTPFPIGQPGVQAVELCSDEPSAGQTAVISGWGSLIPDGRLSNQLTAENVTIIDHQVCKLKYNTILTSVTRRMICADMENGGAGFCSGDEGGPLIVNGKQCGVVSWSYRCSSANYPGVYSNVASQLSWIQSIARM